MEFLKLGQAIRTIRRKRGLTQEQLGYKAGVTWEMVSRYERGLSSALPRLEALGKALRTNPAEIYAMAYNLNLADHIEANKSLKIANINTRKLNQIKDLEEFLKEFQEGYDYKTPKWITQLDSNAYLIDSTAIQKIPSHLKESKEFYISPKAKKEPNDYVLQINNGILELSNSENDKAITLGVLIASQSRYR